MLTCSPETGALLAQPEPTECRIEWAIPGWGTGHGEWHEIGCRHLLALSAAHQEADYGPGTHWIITR